MKKSLFIIALIFLITGQIFAQTIIKGQVKNSAGEPIPGANVIIKGTTTGVVTDADGNYTLKNVPADAVLVFTFIGMLNEEKPVGGQSQINVSMIEDIQSLEEVVVVGYGTQKRINLTGSVSTVTSEEIEDLPVANLSTSLIGKMAGVSVSQTSGKPGASTSITIRGNTGSWSSAASVSPLFVIDGVIQDPSGVNSAFSGKDAFDALDASDVESITILKDASAAVYGARAANGVVLVQTKRGKEGKPKITYNGSVGFSEAKKTTKMLSAYDQAKMLNDGYDIALPSDTTLWYSTDELEKYKTLNNNWLNEAWKNSNVTRHSLNISGGSDKVRYFTSGTYYKENGNFINLYSEKYSLKAGIDADITKNLSAVFDLNNTYGQDERPVIKSEDADQLSTTYKTLLQMPKWIPSYIDGKPVGQNMLAYHPMALMQSDNYVHNKSTAINANAGFTYKVPYITGLKLKLQYSRSDQHQFNKEYYQPYTLYTFKTTGLHNHIISNELSNSYQQTNNKDMLVEYSYESHNYQLNGSVNYENTFGRHTISALFLYEQSESNGSYIQASREVMNPGGIDELAAGTTTTQTAYGSSSESGRLSYVGRVNYNYADKYILETSFRYEGSVKFAPAKRWGFFPSASLGWRISEENFFKDNIQFMNYLKLRGSVGLMGNDATSTGQWQQSYSFTTGALFGGTTANTGIAPKNSGLINSDLTWEKTLMYDGGFDSKFLNNKLNFTVDYYFRHSFDVLDNPSSSTPTTIGASTMPYVNHGIVNTWGTDIELGYDGIITNDLNYHIKTYFNWSDGKIIKKYESAGVKGTWVDEIGKSTNSSVEGLTYAGIIRTQKDLDAILAANPNYTIGGKVPELGMMNYKDVGGPNYTDGPDGKIDDNDIRRIHKYESNPYGYGFSLGLSWKQIRIDANFGGAWGGTAVVEKEVYKQTAITTTPTLWKNQPVSPVQNTVAMWKDHWTPDNPNAAMPRAYNNAADNVSEFWCRNAANLDLKTLNISYSLSKSMLTKLKISQLRFYFTGTNLWTIIDHIKYKDPAATSYYSYPLMKSYSFGVNLSL